MGASRVRTGYLICGEPRSGSSFLARILESTGVLGVPREYLSRADLRKQLLRDPTGGVTKLIERAATANGIYGIKLFSYQFDVMTKSGWVDWLPDPRFIHLERDDLLGQAISCVRARQTGKFSSTRETLRPQTYDGRAIAAQLRILSQGQARWRQYFARNAIAPLRLVYEEVAADPHASVVAIARHLGEPEIATVDLSRVEVEIQRDAISVEWRDRFIAEHADRNVLTVEGLAGSTRQWLRRVRHLVELRVRKTPVAWESPRFRPFRG